MAVFCKAVRSRALIENGWKEVSDNEFIPPDDLWKNKPNTFRVYDAIDLHAILGDPENTTGDLKHFCGFEDE
jgi:hypothetical protein